MSLDQRGDTCRCHSGHRRTVTTRALVPVSTAADDLELLDRAARYDLAQQLPAGARPDRVSVSVTYLTEPDQGGWQIVLHPDQATVAAFTWTQHYTPTRDSAVRGVS